MNGATEVIVVMNQGQGPRSVTKYVHRHRKDKRNAGVGQRARG
jgi:hypothetical protein